MALTYNVVEDVVAYVAETSPIPHRAQDLAPADRERLEEIAAREGVSQEYVLDRSRRRLRADLAARQEARRIALLAREKGNPNVC